MRVRERSMLPALRDGGYILVNRWAKRYSVGDMVVARHPASGMLIVKRVGKMAGGMLSLLGDNRAESEDCAVPEGLVLGKVLISV
jgi:phage repressor protein C with HTH and peptisase S24 domain